MDAQAKQELAGIKNDLNWVITQLDDIANGIRRDFVGIGNDLCAKSIEKVEEQYRDVRRKLDRIDPTIVVEGFSAGGGAGGGGGGGGVR